LRRALIPLLAVAALAAAVPASADLRPVRRDFGEHRLPVVRAGEVQIPSARTRGRVRVIVRLAQPPLAAWQAGRRLQGAAVPARLNARSASSRAYLARLAVAQRKAVAELRREIPEARVGRRFRVLLNGLTVDLPASRLPALVRSSFATKVYPSVRFSLRTNRSPSLIGADTFSTATGARGAGVKIAVVDDGIDQTNPFFNPVGFSYPAGFPRGGRRWTNEKVIVARTFPGPGAGRPGRLAMDPQASFHATHVAGIAAGVAGTTASSGADHPPTSGLSGVAPRAWIGNYRVFTVPTPIGHVANTPEIVAAFESAVTDGMDVINFSGGGPQTDPVNDAMIETVRNVAAAGVVSVISAGNDRDEFGLGSAGSPGTAPDAISVAATSNRQVFGGLLEARGGPRMPFVPASGGRIPNDWQFTDVSVTDVGTIVGTDGRPVDRRLCGPAGDVNRPVSTLPPGSLSGTVALASRGVCTFDSKARRARAAGAIGLLLVDNRPGEANGIPLALVVPAGMVSDLDGAALRDHMAARGGRTSFRVVAPPQRIETERGGIVTSFSSAGPTAFDHLLKPDLAAPGGHILSATTRGAGGPFAVFDGTSMSAPHVAGAAALLLERHPGWQPRQVKSALVNTAVPAWENTARTAEASVLLAGGGMIEVNRADAPLLFAIPSTLSFRDLDVNAGTQRRGMFVRLDDAGGGAGSWTVEVRPQRATRGATLEAPPAVAVAPGGGTDLAVFAHAEAGADPGENYGFVVLRRGDTTRRIPYLFIVTRPALASMPAERLDRLEVGDTTNGPSRVDAYKYPSAPFGPAPDYFGPPMHQPGAERLYVKQITEPVANFGAAVILASPNALIEPWLLGSKDETDVQGYAGTPVNVNPLTFDFSFDIGVAGASLPRPKTYYFAVDSGADPFDNRALPGQFLLQSWVNDVLPPQIVPLHRTVTAGRPTIAARVFDIGGQIVDPGSGVDPLSLVIAYRRVLVGAALYDPLSGIAIFVLPPQAPAIPAGRTRAIFVASDNQEAKNVNTFGPDVMPNTNFVQTTLRAVRRPTITWLVPERNECAARTARLGVLAGSTARIRSVQFFDGAKRIAVTRRGTEGLYAADWRTRGAKKGVHRLRAVVLDARGRRAATVRPVRVCR
jgi:minor extracellular serine protease Vpr